MFEDGVPGARVIRIRGMHYIFLSNESDVLREMRSFLSVLKEATCEVGTSPRELAPTFNTSVLPPLVRNCALRARL